MIIIQAEKKIVEENVLRSFKISRFPKQIFIVAFGANNLYSHIVRITAVHKPKTNTMSNGVVAS